MRNRFFQALRNWQLRRKLIVVFLMLVMLPILLFSTFVAWQTHRSMSSQVEQSFSNSVHQIGMRIEDQMENYSAALRYMAMNRPFARMFEDAPQSYYEQYSNITDILEPMLLMIQQLTPGLEGVGVYTDNHRLKERDDSVIYLDRLSEADWYPSVEHRHRLQWFVEGQRLIGLSQLMRRSSLAPESFAYVRIPMDDVFSVALENIDQYAISVETDSGECYSMGFNMETLDVSGIDDGVHTIDREPYILSRQPIEALGWTLCVYSPYDRLGIDIRDTLRSLLILGAVSLALLSVMGVWIAGSISSRLNRLNESMTMVEGGQLDQEIETPDRDEIGELTRHFNRMVNALKQNIRINYENKILIREAELKALQAQINPHFLYNSLSLINWMAIEREDMEISEIACAMSDFYRSVLNHGESEVKVRDELANIEAYLKIQSAMHDGSFQVRMDVEPELLDCEILGVILQPIVENAIEHGLDHRREAEGAVLTITGRQVGEQIEFTVTDNGPGMSPEQFRESTEAASKSYGLKNVQDRLRIAYGEGCGLSLEPSRAEGTCISIRIPYRKCQKKVI